MKDRQILELIAVDQGLRIYGESGDENGLVDFDIGPRDIVPWNPLRYLGDALALAISRCMVVNITRKRVYAGDADGNGVTLDTGDDPKAATCRAISLAAVKQIRGE